MVAKTDRGRIRESNQDAYFVGEMPDGTAFAVVCDGMGGAAGGNIASSLAVQVISSKINASYHPNMRDSSICNMLESALSAANVEVYDLAREKADLRGMGTTVVCAVIRGGQAFIAHAGDSRAYLFSADGLQQVTTDHSMVQDLLESGNYTGLSDARASIQLAQNKMQLTMGVVSDFSARIADLTARRDAADAASVYTPITAPAAGYFVSAQDSEKQMYTPEALAAMSPAELKDALAQPSQTNDANVAGKLILDYRWRYYGLVTQKQAEKFVEGTRVEISFPNVSAESVPATVVNVTVDEENGTAKVELLCDYINETVVTLEHEKADITFATYEGIRIDRQALHIVEGQNCVFVKYGNLVYQKNITILFENEDYILVPSKTTTGENEVKLFDEIVVRGTDLYDGKIL